MYRLLRKFCPTTGFGSPILPKEMCLSNSSDIPIQLKYSGTDALQLKSPNYPFFYPLDQPCLWTIEAESDQRLLVEFQMFRLIGDVESLSIGNGNVPNDDEQVLVARGRTMSLRVFSLEGNRMWIRWVTNDTILSGDRSYEYWVWKYKDEISFPHNESSYFGFKMKVTSFSGGKDLRYLIFSW